MVFRERRPSRHRAVESDPEDLMPEDELESYLAALSPEADSGPGSELAGRFGSAQVFQLRLPARRIEQLQRIAAERGVPPTTLLVDWVIERIDREDWALLNSPSHPHGAPPPPPHRAEPEVPLSPIDQLNPIGEVTSVAAEATDPATGTGTATGTTNPVTPLFGTAAHAAKPEQRRQGPRHRAPEPVTSLLTRRKF
jgi:hypothetical protein